MILAKATWTEVEALDREQVVIVPVGGTEQHGPSLPLGTSTILAEAVTDGVHKQLGDEVIILPTIPYCVSGMHKAFAGTVDLGYEALIATLKAVVVSLMRHRFRRFLFVVANGGDNLAAVNLALRSMKDAHPTTQFARIIAGGHPLKRGEVLMAVSPEAVRNREDLPTKPLLLPPRGYDCFIVDTDEVSPSGFRFLNHEDVQENGEEYVPSQIAAAVEIVGVMREGRVYVEEEPEG